MVREFLHYWSYDYYNLIHYDDKYDHYHDINDHYYCGFLW
jgi:hypothetical protein